MIIVGVCGVHVPSVLVVSRGCAPIRIRVRIREGLWGWSGRGCVTPSLHGASSVPSLDEWEGAEPAGVVVSMA